MHPMAISLAELQSRADDYAADCIDELADQRSFAFGTKGAMAFTPSVGPLLGEQAEMMGVLDDWSFRQVVGRLDGPPVNWIGEDKHCPEPLRIELLNRLALLREPDRLLVRTKGNRIRAILSDEYSKFDHKDLIKQVTEAVQTMGVEPEVHRTQLADELRSYVLFPQIKFADDPTPQPSAFGDGGLHPAIYVSNSERGGGKVKITGAVYRFVCGNGIIWGWGSEEVFAVTHRFLSVGAMAVLVAEAVSSGLKMSETAAKTFIDSQMQHVKPVSLRPLVEDWATRYGISVEAKENWLAAITGQATEYGRTKDPRMFDVVNAATLMAQSQGPDEREQMERMAGDLLAQRVSVLIPE